ncbi:hypothetical protein OA405_01990 [Bacteroidota bacterium]|nr:hypothetical protein [Bacteroidota bacterium]MDC3115644.1 hypothetical protein [Bacteroidota bacterium]MDC3230585.1 hypothetical protein [Bacteroidota bacterium]
MRRSLWFILFIWGGSSFSQDTNMVQKSFSSNILSYNNPTSSISFSGYYRFLGFVRSQQETFPNNSGKTFVINSGDYYREPMFLLKLNGKTRDNIKFGADLMLNSLYKGPSAELTQNLTLNLGLNLSTSISTNYGNFNLKAGGVSWYRQSRLTVWGNRSFNRISIFERRPQTPINKIPIDRYSNYYTSGLIDQGIRYGSRAFQGIFLNASKLPLNFSAKGVIGKSNFNRSLFESSDNFTGSFQLKNTLSANYKICYNYLSSWAQIDSLSDDKRSYSIQTIELDRKWNKIQLQMEIGLGKYSDPENELAYGEAILLNLKTSKSTKIPLNIQFYRISPQFVNVTGNFLNTSVMEVFPNVEGVGTTIRTPYSSPMVGLGFPINNRQGVSVNADISLEKLKINGGIGIFSEIEKSDGSLSYIHNVNSQTLSRIYLFAQNWGPYNALNSTYRGIYENVNISDTTTSGFANFKKFFNTVEFQVKYNNKIFGKNYYIFSLTRLNTSQKDFNIVPQIGTQTLISQLSEEIDFSIELNDKAAFVFSYGLEKVIGNSSTDLGDNGEATSTNTFFEKLGLDRFYRYTNSRNQNNTLIGLGIDYKIGQNSMLFYRFNQYRYFDPNFIENNLKGWEMMLELKINF